MRPENAFHIADAHEHPMCEHVAALFRTYENWLGQEGIDICFQNFEEELAGLPGEYAPPKGALLLALSGQHPAGCVAMRPQGIIGCEMKRLYVLPQYRGAGLGRQLVTSIISRGQAAGYRHMVLDTLEIMAGAQALYERLGFVDCSAYYPNPLPGVRYLRLDLSTFS